MSGEFCDTNVLIYAYDTESADKHRVAGALTSRLWEERTGILSTQVLSEFYVNITKKILHPLPVLDAVAILEDLSAWTVVSPTPATISRAIVDVALRYHLNFWDALIVQAAREARADVLWSEDLQDGQLLFGFTVRNPFA